MRVVMFVEKGRAELQDEPAPECGPGQILCRTLYSGLTNGTERNFLLGGAYQRILGRSFPYRFGYQNVGQVVEVGEGLEEFSVGDVVFSGQLHAHVELFALDARPQITTARIPRVVEPLAVTLAPEIDRVEGALLGMASVATRAARRAGARIGVRTLVVGAGGIGSYAAQAAQAAGADVTICDFDSTRLGIAEEVGLRATNASEWDGLAAGGPYDLILETSGLADIDELALLIEWDGTLMLVGGRDRVEYDWLDGQRWESTIQQTNHFSRDDIRQTCRLLTTGRLQIRPLIKDVVPIDEAPAIYHRLANEPGSLLGTVFDWGADSGE
jgi:2-desacetyl-2-hydroxyethyl bacteriochlorophyllide A dehydrogenase